MMMNSRPSRLLVVDDNELNRDMLARRLERKGYVVGLAENGQELLERVKQDAVDLVLLDIEMPEISGLDALQRLRERYSAAELPIIMVTAKAQSDDVVRALDLGANDYLTKPIDFPVAVARKGTQLSHKHAQEALKEGGDRVWHKDGSFRWMLRRAVAVHDACGNALRRAGSQTDITEGKVSDPLTGLPNRLLFIDRVGRLIKHTKRRKDQLFAVLFMD